MMGACSRIEWRCCVVAERGAEVSLRLKSDRHQPDGVRHDERDGGPESGDRPDPHRIVIVR